MLTCTTLLEFLRVPLAGFLHRQQAVVMEYLKAENCLLRERLGGRRHISTDAERRQLSERARPVGRKALRELGTKIVDGRAGDVRVFRTTERHA
jgi:hypothetical protein